MELRVMVSLKEGKICNYVCVSKVRIKIHPTQIMYSRNIKICISTSVVRLALYIYSLATNKLGEMIESVKYFIITPKINQIVVLGSFSYLQCTKMGAFPVFI